MTSSTNKAAILDSNWRRAGRSRVHSQHMLRTSVFSGLILFAYRCLNCSRRWRIGRLFIHLAQRLEGGAMRSATARRIMADFHGVQIGALSYGNCFDPAVVPPGVRIGNYVSIAPNARFFVQNHPLDGLSTHPVFYERIPGIAETNQLTPGNLDIGHDVWIGYNAVVTPGCKRIGNGAVVAAGAVVTKDVPDFAVVAGNPARVLRTRMTEDQRRAVASSEWWNLPSEAAQNLEYAFSRLNDPTKGTENCIASIIIPAHNEAAVIGRCLRGLLADSLPGEIEIVVVANGCNDETCDIARGFGNAVRVLETPTASKVVALNMGDRTASHFPRFYVDADVQLSIDAVRESCRLLSQGDGILAASPRPVWDLKHSNWAVRCFYHVWRFQPYFDDGRLGSGVYALNAEGHERLQKFPGVTADDEYVRQLFAPSERATARGSSFLVTPPTGLSELVHIKTRSRRGNWQLPHPYAIGPSGVSPASCWTSWVFCFAQDRQRLRWRLLRHPMRWQLCCRKASMVPACDTRGCRTVPVGKRDQRQQIFQVQKRRPLLRHGYRSRANPQHPRCLKFPTRRDA